MTDPQTITADTVVSIHYKLALDGGQVVDSSEGREPLDYLHGYQNIVTGLEKALDGKVVGDDVKVTVAPEEGYGARHDEAIHTVKRGQFPGDADLRAGVTFQAQDQAGNPLMGTITSVEDDDVTVDFNHPLAGQSLHFEVSVAAIRAASDEEKEHGHVHGPGGHDHG